MWCGFAIWVAILMYKSCESGNAVPPTPIFQFDKILHFIFFAGGAMALGSCLRATLSIHWSAIFLIVIVTLSILGLADEINQLRITGRSGGDPFDWLADLIGSSAGLAILRHFFYERKRPENKKDPGTQDGN
jgi:VanZ family protein